MGAEPLKGKMYEVKQYYKLPFNALKPEVTHLEETINCFKAEDVRSAVEWLMNKFPGTEPEGSEIKTNNPDGTVSWFNGTYSGQYIQKIIKEAFPDLLEGEDK